MCKKCAYVRLGCGTAVDSLPPEKYALVLTAVAIEGSWRILVVYCQCTIKWKSCSVLQWMSSTTWQRWSLYSAFDPIVPSWWKRLPNPVSSQVVHVILYVWHMMKETYWGFKDQETEVQGTTRFLMRWPRYLHCKGAGDIEHSGAIVMLCQKGP